MSLPFREELTSGEVVPYLRRQTILRRIRPLQSPQQRAKEPVVRRARQTVFRLSVASPRVKDHKARQLPPPKTGFVLLVNKRHRGRSGKSRNQTDPFPRAIDAKPLVLWHVVPVHRWVEAREVERPRAAVAAQEPTRPSARVAKVVVQLQEHTRTEDGQKKSRQRRIRGAGRWTKGRRGRVTGRVWEKGARRKDRS